MKIDIKKVGLIFPITLLLFTACGKPETIETEVLRFSDASNLTDLEYLYESEVECREVLFSCPQKQYPFYNNDGCGCGVPTDESTVPESERTLKHLVKMYLAHKVFPQSVDTSYETLIESLYLNSSQEIFDDYILTDYEMWVEIEQYEVDGAEIILLNKYSGPIEFTIKELGTSYVIESANVYPDYDEQTLKEHFNEESMIWILDQDPDAPSKEIKAEMQKRLASQAEGLAGLAEALFGEDEAESEVEDEDQDVSSDQVTDPEATKTDEVEETTAETSKEPAAESSE